MNWIRMQSGIVVQESTIKGRCIPVLDTIDCQLGSIQDITPEVSFPSLSLSVAMAELAHATTAPSLHMAVRSFH